MYYNSPFEESSDLLIQVQKKAMDESSSWEEIASLLLSSPPESSSLPQLVNTECSLMELSCFMHMHRNHHLQNNEIFHFDRFSNTHFLKEHCSQRYSSMAEGNMKVGRYSLEERRERIDKYRAKRALRNFNKTIKYDCRKRLADGRQRIRGRFVRNDDILLCQHPYHFWIDDDCRRS